MTRLESDYYAFMGFDPDKASGGLTFYTRFFDAAPGPVVEVACGRGEFLDGLKAAGITARGIDVDEGMVQSARSRGLDVELADAFEGLERTPSDSAGGVFTAHFLEHLPVERAAVLLQEVGRVLAPGGTFVAVVPNPACQSVMGYDFWRDPTHVRFYDPMLIGFLCAQVGLSVVESGGNPQNHPGPPPEAIPEPVTVDPSLGNDIAALAQRLASERRRGSRSNNHTVEGIGHLLNVLDQRLRATQEQLTALHRAYRGLLERLYPSNEVFVVARKGEPV